MTKQGEIKAPSLKLPPKRELAAKLIASGATQQQAAAHSQVSVTKQTMSHWCKNPDFSARVDQLRTDLDEQAREIIEGGVVVAAQMVVNTAAGKLVDDPKVIGHRLKAALWILDARKKKKLPEPDVRRNPRSTEALTELTDKEEAEEWLSR